MQQQIGIGYLRRCSFAYKKMFSACKCSQQILAIIGDAIILKNMDQKIRIRRMQGLALRFRLLRARNSGPRSS